MENGKWRMENGGNGLIRPEFVAAVLASVQFSYKLRVTMLLIIILFLYPTIIFANINEIHLARIQYDGGGDWYNDPEVLPNLAEFITTHLPININRRERVVRLSETSLFQNQFSYLTGHGNINATENEIQNLRRYLLQGGFLYVDDDYGLDESFRRFITRVFPDRYMVELPNSHPLFNCFFEFPNGLPKIHEHDNKRPQLFAIHDDSGRIMILYTYESNISDGWADFNTHNNPPAVRETALMFGLNIFYHLFVESR